MIDMIHSSHSFAQLWSGAFSAIGFGMLEVSKGWLGVSDRNFQSSSSKTKKAVHQSSGAACSRPQRSLGNAILNDAQKGLLPRIIDK
jgi:hypothetical protein